MRLHLLFPRGMQQISSALGIVVILFIWIVFAPIQVGGLASYVIVIGSSMEPNFHIGDLIVAHQQPRYAVGDAVVYRNHEMQGFVFHRIIADDMGRYTLQGDNNSWVDTYRPSKEEVIGELWLHIPRGGIAMQKVRSPWMLASIAAVTGGVFAASFFSNKNKGNKHMNKKSLREWFASVKQKTGNWLAQLHSPETPGSTGPGNASFLEGSFFVLGLVLLSSILIGIVSFSRPTSRIVSDDIQYQHLGIFSYMASAPQGIYDANAIKSGDPIFPRLTCAVDVNLQYTLIAQAGTNLAGTYQLTAVIREPLSGWQRKIALQEETSFTGNTFGTTAKLDLCKIESLTQSLEQETEFRPGSYILSVTPNLKVNGELSGHALDVTFDSGLTFMYDHIHFYVQQSEETDNSLSFTETGSIKSVRNEANSVVFLGRQLAVPLLRWIAIIGLVTSLTVFVVLGSRLQALSRSNQAQFFRVKYDSLIVDINDTALIDSSSSVEVKSIDALAKLAERFNTVILHVDAGHLNHYIVQAGGSTYQFRLNGRGAESLVAETEAMSHGGES